MHPKHPHKPFQKVSPPRPKRPAHTLSIRPAVLYLGFGILLAGNVLTLVGFLMAPDIARLYAGQSGSVLIAYEDRIAQLRVEVDRLQSRHYVQAGDINLQLQELAQQQEVLLEQHQYVKLLAGKAAQLGIETAALPADGASDDTLVTGSIESPGGAGATVASVAASVDAMIDDSRLALAALSGEASSKTDEIMSTLAGIGIKPKLPSFDDGVGGPLLPPVEGVDTSSSLIDDANNVAEALERFKVARNAADLAPVHRPLAVPGRISSTFGNRKDPFTGRFAFHSGMDFAAPRGTTVLSAGSGKVTFVGQMSGYGNMVEVTHGNGLITRYGHLSAFLVKEGQNVDTGSPIARVGSTGRSTGPHLHFEVRRADNAVDPSRYLSAGRKLAQMFS